MSLYFHLHDKIYNGKDYFIFLVFPKVSDTEDWHPNKIKYVAVIWISLSEYFYILYIVGKTLDGINLMYVYEMKYALSLSLQLDFLPDLSSTHPHAPTHTHGTEPIGSVSLELILPVKVNDWTIPAVSMVFVE